MDDIYLYVEKETGYIFEVKFFENFAMMKLAVPGGRSDTFRLDHIALSERFRELHANPEPIWALLNTVGPLDEETMQ